MHQCENWILVGSGNALSPVWRQAIAGTDVDLSLIGQDEIHVDEIKKFRYLHPRKGI